MSRNASRAFAEQPWFVPPAAETARDVVVIGAGVAGAGAAFSLAEAGFSVRVFERRETAAAETSAHPAAVVMPIISLKPAAVSSYHVAAYEHTLQRIHTLIERGLDPGWHPCGALHLLNKPRLQKLYEGLASTGLSARIVTALSAAETAERVGLPLQEPALFFPEAGWLHPPSFVQAQLAHERISFLPASPVDAIQSCGAGWRLLDAAGGVMAETPLLVLANAGDCLRFRESDWFPLIRIRGQLAYVAPEHCGRAPRTVVCHDGYTVPATGVGHLMGATFDYHRDDEDLDRADFEELVQRNQALLALQTEIGALAMRGRVAFRSKCHDHLPMVGAVPDYEAYMRHYHDITKGRSFKNYPAAPYVPGLYVTTAHGSRGMISSVMAGTILADQMGGAAAPLEESLLAAVHPGRFIVRRLLRRQPPLRAPEGRQTGDASMNEWR